jgi:ABC-type antimicrobial peptide transport system permease subunit
MQKFDPQLVQVMRNALEEVMTRVPLQYSTSSTKAYLAEYILKTAAQGQTNYDQLVAAAADQIDQIQAVLLPFI